MKLRTLAVEKFGLFTGRNFDFSRGGRGGFHLIYGPNESGKSTTLRAISALLFGIPPHTQDAHMHPLKHLRVSAELEREVNGSVERLAITRLGGKRDSLRDEADKPVSVAALAPYLRGIDRASFETRFGLTKAELKLGAEALLAGKEEGLFAASTAGASVASVLARLGAELDSLYRPRGEKFPLNALLSELEKADQALRVAERSPEAWLEQTKSLELAASRVQALEQERRQLRAALTLKVRQASVLTNARHWLDVQSQLHELRSVPNLAEDAPEARARALTRHRDADHAEQNHEAELAHLREGLLALAERSSLTDVEDERLAALRNLLGIEEKSRTDLPKRRQELTFREEGVSQLLQRLGRPGQEPAQLLLELANQEHVRSLVAEGASITSAVEEVGRTVARLSHELAEIQSESASDVANPDEAAGAQQLSTLRAQLASARNVLGLVGSRARLVSALQVLAIERERRAAGLGWTALASPGEPQEGPLSYLLEQERQLIAAARAVSSELEASRSQAEEAEARALSLKSSFDLPSEKSLLAARLVRDDVIARLEAVAELAAAIDRSLLVDLRRAEGQVDQLADRLRREAARISELATLAMDAAAARVRERRCLVAHAELKETRAGWQVAYSAYWQELQLDAPEPAHALATGHALSSLRALDAERDRQAHDLSVLDQEVEERRVALGAALGPACPAPATLALLVQLAEELLLRSQQRKLRVESLRKAEQDQGRVLGQEQARLAQASERLQAWRGRWSLAMQRLGLPTQATAAEVNAYLTGLSELGAALGQSVDMRRRVEGMERDTRQFVERVAEFTRDHAPDLSTLDASRAAEVLLARAREAREQERERQRLQQEFEARRALLATATAKREAAERELRGLMDAARVTDLTLLAEMEEKSARRRALQRGLHELEEALRPSAAGLSVEELVQSVHGLEHDNLRAALTELEEREPQLEDELQAAVRSAEGLQLGLERFRAQDVASSRQAWAGRKAAASHALREYLVKKAAGLLLTTEAKRYAEENQGALVSRAQELFARLTLGAYSGLSVGLERRALHCVRAGNEVDVADLSEGARGQLYFALRLASLERDFAEHGALPLVFDDLFVEFDENRATATFEVLGELAEHAQIIYFTHLSRDVEAATDAVPPSRLVVHQLGVT